jgi:phosphatidylinositol glycan class N
MPLPLLSPPRVVPRFASVYLAAATAYALFSVSYESLFYAALGFASLAWLVLERHVQKLAAADALFDGDKTRLGSRVADPNADVAVTFATSSAERGADKSVARHAATFLALINAAFFGTGNIASVASFEISSVYRFTTRFNPFLMGALLMLKVLVPMITVAVAFLCLLKLRATPPFPAYLVFIALSDLMSVTFFFEVTTEGSWQDIGMSISRYALMGTQVVTILVFLGLAETYAAAIPIRGVVARRAGNDAGKKTR